MVQNILLLSSFRKASIRMIAVIVVFLAANILTTATFSQDLPEDAWSVVKSDPTNTGTGIGNYVYVPAPKVTSYVNLYDGIAGVGPNFRPKPGTGTQSEMSVAVHPTNTNIIFCSANAMTGSSFYGTGVYWSTDGGTVWGGSDNPPFGANAGDPVSVISRTGTFYESYIPNSYGQSIAVSTNNGANWTAYSVAPNPGSLADKNHATVDNVPTSPYYGRVYVGWTDFGGVNNYKAVMRYSTNNGQTWSATIPITNGVTGYLHQGVNLQVGPNGELYAFWAVYLGSDVWDGEDAIGYNKSTDGGVTWGTAKYIFQATNFGLRGYLKPTSIRVSSFPSGAVDCTGGVTNGYIYCTWPQQNVAPAGSSPDIVMVRSTDGGATFSTPVRVNDDPIGNGKDQYYPWMCVDQATSQLDFVFYDARNCSNDSSEVYMARSIDGGVTFENFLVTQARFKPKPIPGLAGGYQGDYIGVAALNNIAYPYWMDDRTGNYQGWMSVVTFGPAIVHAPLPNTENMVGPYTINAEITSAIPLNISSIKLHWGRGAGVIDQEVTMTNTTGNNFTAQIPGNGLPSIYNYYIYAADQNGGYSTLPGGAPANHFTFEANTDNVPPVITHDPLDDQTINRWPATVQAAVTDNIGVDSVKCEYRINNGAITGSFVMPNTGGNTFSALFNVPVGSIALGDSVEYKIRAKDASLTGNVAYLPSSGYYKFYIIDTKGLVLVINDDAAMDNRGNEKGEGDLVTPLGASSTFFTTTLTNDGYTVDEVTFGAFNPTVLPGYDIIVLSAGPNGGTMFNDAAKRTAIVNWTLTGGKTIGEGGELGYIYRQQTSEIDANFRRNVLNDSTWLGDLSAGGDIVFKIPYNPIYNSPNVLTGPIGVTNNSYYSRDAMRLVNKVGVKKVGTWTTAQDSASLIIYYVGGDTTKPRNVTFHFTLALITNQTVAQQLVENVAWLLSPKNIVPVELVSFNADVNETAVNLSWVTSTETNNSGFEVERRTARRQVH